MRGRGEVRIQKNETTPGVDHDTEVDDPVRIALRIATQHSSAANQMTHVARRIRSLVNMECDRKKRAAHNQNDNTISAYLQTTWQSDTKLIEAMPYDVQVLEGLPGMLEGVVHGCHPLPPV